MSEGGRYDFDDGGSFCGQWDTGKAHGYGICTGPKGQGEYSGAWHYGFEVSGVYVWPSGTSYEGQWQNGKRHGLGVEKRGRWVYKGEWSQGLMGRYGVRSCRNSTAKYEGTWLGGLQDGYGTETYADSGTYQGQWFRGMRHGYGIRKSAQYGVASKMRERSAAHASLTSIRSDFGETQVNVDGKRLGDDTRGGFALRSRSEPAPRRRRTMSERSLVLRSRLLTNFRIFKQRSAGDINQKVQGSLRSSGSATSCTSEESGLASFSGELGPDEQVDGNVTEAYYGEWKNDRRSGFGVSERSDGLKYEGEWFNNRKHGYGITYFKDGSQEEGKYRNNVLVLSTKRKNLLFVRATKLRQRVDAGVMQASRGAQVAMQKADIAASRMATAIERRDQADMAAGQAVEHGVVAKSEAKRICPDYGTAADTKRRLADPLENQMPKPSLRPQPPNLVPGVVNFGPSTSIPNRLSQPSAQTSVPSSVPDNPHLSPQPSPTIRPSMISPGAGTSTPVKPPSRTSIDHTPAKPPSRTSIDHSPRPSRTSIDHTPNRTADNPSPSLAAANRSIPSSIPNAIRSPIGAKESTPPMETPPSELRNTRPRDEDTLMMNPEQLIAHHKQSFMAGMANNASSFATDLSERLSNYGQGPPSPMPATYSNPSSSSYTNPTPSNYVSQTASTYPNATLHANQIPNTAPYANQTPSSYPHPASSNLPNQTPTNYSPMRPRPPPLDVSTYGNPTSYPVHSNPSTIQLGLPPGATSGAGDESQNSSRNSLNQRINDHYDQYSGPPVASPGPSYQTGPSFQPPPVRRTTITVAPDPAAVAAAVRSGGRTDEWSPTGSLRRRYDSKESLPDDHEITRRPIIMPREEAARLAHLRREEVQRMREEGELLRANPLRYLFHPAVREWFTRHKLMLLLFAVNLSLSILFYHLLSPRRPPNS